MYYGYCLKEPYGWMPVVNLPSVEDAWRYSLRQGQIFNEVRITDEEDHCVIHIKDQEVIFPGENEGISPEAAATFNRHLRGV